MWRYASDADLAVRSSRAIVQPAALYPTLDPKPVVPGRLLRLGADDETGRILGRDHVMRLAPMEDPLTQGALARLCTAADRKPTNARPRFVEDDDASVFQWLFNCRQIGQQQFGLALGSAVAHLPEQDQRGPRLALNASKAAKSVSAYTRMRSSPLARSNIASSAAVAIA
jgi:hypothetical protein